MQRGRRKGIVPWAEALRLTSVKSARRRVTSPVENLYGPFESFDAAARARTPLTA